MRASDLLGRTVRGADGEPLGRVIGIRAVQDGPLRGAMASLRVDAVIVDRRRFGARLGYQYDAKRGPWALGSLLRWWHRHAVVVPWREAADQLLQPGHGRRSDTG
jgi:hypothetical protein